MNILNDIMIYLMLFLKTEIILFCQVIEVILQNLKLVLSYYNVITITENDQLLLSFSKNIFIIASWNSTQRDRDFIALQISDSK